MQLAPGSRIGRYEILTPLGAGGMGEVYRARDSRLDRDVAVKILPNLFAADPDRLDALSSPRVGQGLLEMPSDGGSARPLLNLQPETEADFHHVSALSGGRGLLFVTHPTGTRDFQLELYVPADGTRRVIPTPPGDFGRPVCSPTGHVLFERGGGVWMIPFSLDRLAATGDASLLTTEAREPSVARDGTLVMLPGARAVTMRN